MKPISKQQRLAALEKAAMAPGTRKPRRAASRGSGAAIVLLRSFHGRTRFSQVAEADGNRTRRRRCAPSAGFEDRGDHQVPRRLRVDLIRAGSELRPARLRDDGEVFDGAEMVTTDVCWLPGDADAIARSSQASSAPA